MSVLYIVNPISGRRGRKSRIVRGLKKRGCAVQFTSCPGDAVEIARNASQDTIVAVGGDGTLNEVARGLVGTGKTLGILPCGSGDGLARHLGLRRSFRSMMRIIGEGRTAPLDWGTIDGKPFFSVCGTGLDAIVSERFAKAGSRGLKTYIREAIATWKGFEPDTYRITVDGVETLTQAVLVTVGNSCQWGNGARITPQASTCDGLLDVTVVKMFRSIEIPVLVWRLMTGSILGSRRVIALKGKEITIERTGSGPAHFDGDYTSAGSRIDIRAAAPHQRLKVIVPSSFRAL